MAINTMTTVDTNAARSSGGAGGNSLTYAIGLRCMRLALAAAAVIAAGYFMNNLFVWARDYPESWVMPLSGYI
ncbi:hypothetical protein OEZ49_14545 [Ruegeria sp. WL0004]|uniref:Uncharacterized protein n=1 Tax=Ruegeria marisflavi TaxID=2984152 RepID=A0ABT2WYG4_9RHOB|nr:hypothetical protein [Ruegeria sp. WL0004]MCU9838993.1 hypothetical protein [Ruegeria sp. WL0004]